MCGAASESKMLAIATAKKNEEDVLKMYVSANGRSRVENLIVDQAKEYLKREYQGYSTLIKYW